MSSLIFYGTVRSMVQVWGNSASPGNTGSFVVAICFDFGHALGLTVIYKFKALHGHLQAVFLLSSGKLHRNHTCFLKASAQPVACYCTTSTASSNRLSVTWMERRSTCAGCLAVTVTEFTWSQHSETNRTNRPSLPQPLPTGGPCVMSFFECGKE